MTFRIQAAAVYKCGIRHAKSLRPLVHLLHECRLAAPYVFRHRHAAVVGAGNGYALDQRINRLLLSSFQEYLTASHGRRILADCNHIVLRDLPFRQCIIDQISVMILVMLAGYRLSSAFFS